MDRDELIAAINLLSEQMEHETEDLHEVHMKLHEMLNELKALGMPLPEDLVALDRYLEENVEGGSPDT